jgi:hypothetical protein
MPLSSARFCCEGGAKTVSRESPARRSAAIPTWVGKSFESSGQWGARNSSFTDAQTSEDQFASSESTKLSHEDLSSSRSDWSKNTMSPTVTSEIPVPKTFSASSSSFPEQNCSSFSSDNGIGESSLESFLPAVVKVSRVVRRALMRRFRGEARFARKDFRALAKREWDSSIATDKENRVDHSPRYGSDDEDAYDDYIAVRLQDFDRDSAAKKHVFQASLRADSDEDSTVVEDAQDAALREQWASNLWEGLRRVYFGEEESPVLPLEVPDVQRAGTVMSAREIALRQKIADLFAERARIRRAIDEELRRRPRRFHTGESALMTTVLFLRS